MHGIDQLAAAVCKRREGRFKMYQIFILCTCLITVYCTIGAQIPHYCNHLQTPDFIGAKNRILQGFVYCNRTASHAAICVRDCMIDSRCVSINYFEHENLCQLNYATRSQFPGNFSRLLGSFYFDNDRHTILFSAVASCKELLQAVKGHIPSGVYTIFPSGLSGGLQVYCDMEENDGGWIVFQRRQNGTEDFYRNWADYQKGFGDLSGEFWLGNNNLRALTEASPIGTWELRIDMEDWEGETAFAEYFEFRITGDDYTLHVNYSKSEPTAVGDSLTEKHSGQRFSTRDRDNDESSTKHCAIKSEGAWWYKQLSWLQSQRSLLQRLKGAQQPRHTVEHLEGKSLFPEEMQHEDTGNQLTTLIHHGRKTCFHKGL